MLYQKLKIMKTILLLCTINCLLASCTTQLSYVGNKFPATSTIDVYVNEAAIKKPYTIVGKGYLESRMFYSTPFKNKEQIMQATIKKAKQYGADGVFFFQYIVLQDGRSINSTTTTTKDSTNNSIKSNTNSVVINNVASQQEEILFIKYN